MIRVKQHWQRQEEKLRSVRRESEKWRENWSKERFVHLTFSDIYVTSMFVQSCIILQDFG